MPDPAGAPLFASVVVVDWSASTVPKRGPDSIWWAQYRSGSRGPRLAALENPATRAEAVGALTALLLAERAAGRRVLVGVDFPFGYPAGFAAALTGEARALAVWDWLAARITDGPDNANNRFEIAAEINRRFDGIGPFWGRPATLDIPDLPARGRSRTARARPAERRIVERRVRRAQPVWKLFTTGSVGGQVLVGLPCLWRLRADTGAAVWPFDTGLGVPEAELVLAEVYPSLVPPDPDRPDPDRPVKDAGQVTATARALARLDAAGALAEFFEAAPDLDADERAAVAGEEAWILGAGGDAALAGAAA